MRWWLYAAVLTMGAAFSILFTGETVDEEAFGGLSVVAIVAGYTALIPMLLAAAVGVLVGSAGRWRFVLLVPAGALYTILCAYGMPPVFSPGEWQEFGWRIGNDVIYAAGTMYADPVPYDLAPGIFVVLAPAVVIVATFATSAALYEGSPVMSVAVLGLTIGVLSTVAFEDGAGPFFAVFLGCAVGLLLSAGSLGPEGPGRTAVLAGAAVVVLALLVPRLPFSDATISPGFIDWTRIGTGGTSQLDVQADVGDYLTAGRDAELFRVRSPEPLLWRAGTLDSFDGVRWEDTTGPAGDDGTETAPGVDTRSVTQSVEILNAQTDVFFGAYEIVQTNMGGYEVTQNSDSSWTLDEPFEEGDRYVVRSEIPQPSGEQLRAADESYTPYVERKFLQLPSDTPDVVGETADRIGRGYDTSTAYDAARAVEQYLIYDGGFVYNLDVSYRRADQAIEEFLGDGREGFCTQFATSMALILRDMDIPARVVYGSTSGEEVDGEYVVTGSNMHTWVEVYFPGVGWYPFNPTPGFSMPSTMEQNAPQPRIDIQSGINGAEPGMGNFGVREAIEGNPVQENGQSREDQQPNQDRDSRANEQQLPVWPLLAVLTVLLVAAVPLAKRALAARGRPEDLYDDLTGRLRDALRPGGAIADSSALTPTEKVLLLAGAAGVEEEPMRRFARAYSDHLYSRSGDPRGVSSAYRRALRAYGRLPLWRRVLAALNPGSLLSRTGRSVAAGRSRLAKTARGKIHGALRGRPRGRR